MLCRRDHRQRMQGKGEEVQQRAYPLHNSRMNPHHTLINTALSITKRRKAQTFRAQARLRTQPTADAYACTYGQRPSARLGRLRVSRSPHTTAHIARPQQGDHVPKARPGGLRQANSSDGVVHAHTQISRSQPTWSRAGQAYPCPTWGYRDPLRTIRKSETDSRQHTVYTVTKPPQSTTPKSSQPASTQHRRTIPCSLAPSLPPSSGSLPLNHSLPRARPPPPSPPPSDLASLTGPDRRNSQSSLWWPAKNKWSKSCSTGRPAPTSTTLSIDRARWMSVRSSAADVALCTHAGRLCGGSGGYQGLG